MLIVLDYPWLSVSGFGAHIKSTQSHLIIQKKQSTERYSLKEIKHLLIVGGHTISSMTISQLVKNGCFITFFDSDGTPVGVIKPYCDPAIEHVDKALEFISPQRYAITIAQASVKSRLFAIERIQETRNVHLFYEGEHDVLWESLEELEYLIKLDEIRRLHKLASDMYYEIMSRSIPADFGYKRRTMRPQRDPINAMLSFGYALLFGNCSVAAIGAHLDPDSGVMHTGKGSLIFDLIDPLKAKMVDSFVFQIAQESLTQSDYELTDNRCLLSDELLNKLMAAFYTAFTADQLNEQVSNFYNAAKHGEDFKSLY